MGPGRRLSAWARMSIILVMLVLAGLGTVSIYRVLGTVDRFDPQSPGQRDIINTFVLLGDPALSVIAEPPAAD